MKQASYQALRVKQKLARRAQVLANLPEVRRTRLLTALQTYFGGARSGKKSSVSKDQLERFRLRIYNRSTRLTEACVGLPVRVHDGRSWILLYVTPGMVGYPVRAFVQSRRRRGAKGKKKR